MKVISNFQNRIFQLIHNHKLIYNTCWEDPRCDRMLMDLDEDSEVVMITSAGDNALDYMLDQPTKVHCVDMNYRQNALLELKKAALTQLEHAEFFAFFGQGRTSQAKTIYQDRLRNQLPDYAQSYWDKYIKYFSGKGLRKSFYYRGTSGLLAYGLTSFLKMRNRIHKNVQQLFAAQDLEEQSRYYDYLENRVFNRPLRLLVNNHYAMCLAGVPRNQQELINQSYDGGPLEYIQTSFRKIFTTLDINDNYFYQVYFQGRYTEECCPEYLKAKHFDSLRKQQSRIQTYTTTLSQFLHQQPGQYSHFVLLDHQDWLAAHDRPALEEEWRLILANSRPGTKILLRSAAKEIDFFPDFVLDRVDFDQPETETAHELDRVGTYASVYLGIVR